MMRKAILAGSFDPITLGHLWVLRQGLAMFDEMQVLIAVNPTKKGMFSNQDRFDMIEQSIEEQAEAGFFGEQAPKVTIEFLPEHMLTVSYAKHIGASHIIRGIRNTTDFEYEHQLNLINQKIAPDIETIFVMPPRELIEVSSSLVKSLIQLDGWYNIAKGYVPKAVLDMLDIKTLRH